MIFQLMGWGSDCCLTSNEQVFSYIMGKTEYFVNDWHMKNVIENRKSWHNVKVYVIESKHQTLFTTYTLQYWIICSKKLKVGDIFILYCIVLIYKFDLKNSIGQLIHIRMLSYDMSTVNLTSNISQWKTCYIIIALECMI